MPTATFFTSRRAENRWRNHMRYNYTSKKQINPCVSQVPDYLRNTMPEAYIPQIVGLGPYHHFRPDLQLMGARKRAAVEAYLREVKRDFNHFLNLVDQSLVDYKSSPDKNIEDDTRPSAFEVMIRSCYDRYIDLGKETLAWILIVDGTFLLHFIFTYLDIKGRKEKHKLYPDAEKLAVDILMLENQIPIVLLLKIHLFFQLPFDIDKHFELLRKFYLFCTENSPLELTSDPVAIDAAFDKNNHLLNFMYQMIMKNYKDQGHSQSEGEEGPTGDRIPRPDQGDERAWIQRLKAFTREPIKRLKIFAREATNHGSEILGHAIEEFNSALTTATNAGLKVPGNIQKISQILRNFEKTFQLSHNKQDFPGDKIEIPSATRLFAILNVKFKPLPKDCGIGNIDLKIVDGKKEFYLPVIHMRANSEVIVRNMIAYEATIFKQKQGSTRFRDFVDLICGLIKTEKDVKLLEKAQIMIIDKGFSREEIVKMCNGIAKSDEKPDKKSKVHITVKNANNHFNNATMVKFCKWLMKCIADLLKFIRPFFPLMVLILLAFQSACEIYDCKRRPDGGAAMQNPYLGDYSELDPQANLKLPRKVLRYQSI